MKPSQLIVYSQAKSENGDEGSSANGGGRAGVCAAYSGGKKETGGAGDKGVRITSRVWMA